MRLKIWLVFPASLLTFMYTSEATAQEPFVVAHRGLLLDAPENTLANFRSCLQLGLGFEVDVQRSKDGHLVCVHDDTVNRTTNGKGKVTDLTLQQLRTLDAGSWFASKFHGQKIPTLDEVFAEIAKHKNTRLLIAVDIKGPDSNIEADIIRLAEQHKVIDKLLMIGRTIGDADVRKRLRAASQHAHIATVANSSDEFATALADKQADWVYVRYVPSKSEVVKVHQANKRVFIAGSTVSGLQLENWKQATSSGVDAILTDYSLRLARELRKQ